MIDYVSEYFTLDTHNDVKIGDFMYAASFNSNGDILTHVVKVCGLRQEYNPYYTLSKGPDCKFFEPQYEVSLVSQSFTGFFSKLFNKKSLVLSEAFWVQSCFLKFTEKEAIASLLTHLDTEQSRKAKEIFEISNPGYLSDFEIKSTSKFKTNHNPIVKHFNELYQLSKLESTQNDIKQSIKEIVS